MAPLFSVVIPVFNREHLISQTLDSLAEQQFRDFEVIVVDDGSTDGTVNVVRAHRQPTVLIQQANQGPGAARNTGIRAARGQYLAFLDSDDLWTPQTLEMVAGVVQDENHPAWIMLAARKLSASSTPTSHEQPVLVRYPTAVDGFLNGCTGGSGHWVLRRDVATEGGDFFSDRVHHGEDTDAHLRHGTFGSMIHIQSPALLLRRWHAASLVQDVRGEVRGISFLLDRLDEGCYPTDERWRAIRDALMQELRNRTVRCLHAGNARAGLGLYRRGVLHAIARRRWRWVLLTPLLMLGVKTLGRRIKPLLPPDTRRSRISD